MQKPTDDRDQQDLYAAGGIDAAGDMFGLQLKGNDDDDADYGSDDDEEGEV